MSIVLLLAQLLVQLTLAVVIVAGAGFGMWLLWDTTVGPSARAAAARRRPSGGARP
ncbi:hypothetical protein ACTXJ9_10920 [Brachybacterium tyrofermentans]|uniref:hypothetical protein n=1 Tax=Brachybacterium tyrofermentans TaxID=47848 RepID=UPI003FD3B112